MAPQVLVIDDEQEVCELLAMALAQHGMSVVACTSTADALDRLAQNEFDAVLTDLAMPELDGIQACERIAGSHPGLPVIVVTGQGSMEAAIAAIRVGAYDFVTKPVDPNLILLTVTRAVQDRKLREEVKRLREVAGAGTTPSEMVGTSAAMRRVHETVARIAGSDASVLVHGETGTGKELVARRIHALSPRKDGPFVAINCAAVPPTLLESELFGHARGAFTDAKAERAGLFVQADQGTLFLDEIAETPLDMQAKLLRSLQERTVRPVGTNNEISFDARILTASNRDLDSEIREKRFREDLYYRVNVVRIDVPPLRSRSSDVLELAQHFLAQHAVRIGKTVHGLSAEAAQKLLAYSWPGNVRELENCMEHAVAFARYDQITVEDLPNKIGVYAGDPLNIVANDANEVVPLAEVQRRYMTRVLSLFGGNKKRAAEALGIDRRTLHRKLVRWDAPASPDADESLVEGTGCPVGETL
jgi:two-component system response regulator HydG